MTSEIAPHKVTSKIALTVAAFVTLQNHLNSMSLWVRSTRRLNLQKCGPLIKYKQRSSFWFLPLRFDRTAHPLTLKSNCRVLPSALAREF
jgi:hypothetical protein